MVWWDNFHKEAGWELLTVLHLGQDWLSSPSTPPYKCPARPRFGSERHPEPLLGMRRAWSQWELAANPTQRPPGWALERGSIVTPGCARQVGRLMEGRLFSLSACSVGALRRCSVGCGGCAGPGSAFSWWCVLVAVHTLKRAAWGLRALRGLVALLPAVMPRGLCLAVPVLSSGPPVAWKKGKAPLGFIGCPVMPLPM